MARCHVADTGAVTLNLVIYVFVETGGSIAHQPHEFECERGQCQHPSKTLGVRIHGEHEAIGEPDAWQSQQGQRGPSG